MKQLRISISIILLSLFTFYQISTMMFIHVHYVNGVRIAHSHPFSAHHTHSSSELLTLDKLAHYNTLEALSFNYITSDIIPYYTLEYSDDISLNCEFYSYIPSLRAPPVYSII